VPNIGLNPTRAGLFETLREMGADLTYENPREEGGEPVADLRARFSPDMKGIEVPPERAASMIDEYPILSVVAACAEGRTEMRGVKELRVKESDRIAAMADGLRACGVTVEDGPDWWTVEGRGPIGRRCAGRRDLCQPSRPPHRDVVPRVPRAGAKKTGHGRRRRADRHLLPDLRAADGAAIAAPVKPAGNAADRAGPEPPALISFAAPRHPTNPRPAETTARPVKATKKETETACALKQPWRNSKPS
jgi:hypothetical protein